MTSISHLKIWFYVSRNEELRGIIWKKSYVRSSG